MKYCCYKCAVGFYRDGGFAAIFNANGQKLYRMRKNFIALFPQEGFLITIETNLIQTALLDIFFNLVTEKYFPFRKTNNAPLSINTLSNHLPTIIQQLP